MTRDEESTVTLGSINPSLARMIEDIILFGQRDELARLLDLVKDHPDVSATLREGLESLHYFRAHYGHEGARLSASARQRVSQFDTDWSMQLLDQLRDDHSMEAEALSA